MKTTQGAVGASVAGLGATAAMNPALPSAGGVVANTVVGGLQTFSVLSSFSTGMLENPCMNLTRLATDGSAGDDGEGGSTGATDMHHLNEELSWINLRSGGGGDNLTAGAIMIAERLREQDLEIVCRDGNEGAELVEKRDDKASSSTRAPSAMPGASYDMREVAGTSPVGYILQTLYAKEKEFERNVTFAVALGSLLLMFHYPTVQLAKKKAADQERAARRKGNLQKKLSRRHLKRHGHAAGDDEGVRGTVVGAIGALGHAALHIFGVGGKHGAKKGHAGGGPTPMQKYSHTFPRLEGYILMLGYQGLCQTCSFTIASASTTVAAKVFAGFMFALWPVGFLWHSAKTIKRKVIQERRALLVADRKKRGVVHWVDAWPTVMNAKQRLLHAQGGHNYTGMVDECPSKKVFHRPSTVER